MGGWGKDIIFIGTSQFRISTLPISKGQSLWMSKNLHKMLLDWVFKSYDQNKLLLVKIEPYLLDPAISIAILFFLTQKTFYNECLFRIHQHIFKMTVFSKNGTLLEIPFYSSSINTCNVFSNSRSLSTKVHTRLSVNVLYLHHSKCRTFKNQC